MTTPQRKTSLMIDAGELSKILNGLTDEQRSVVESYNGGPLRVMAIPGSGKTHTMIRLFAKCWKSLHGNRRPSRGPKVRFVTFTRKAAGEAGERIESFVGGSARQSVSTFHSIAIRVVRENEDIAEEVWCKNPAIMDIKDVFPMINKGIKNEFGEDSEISAKDVLKYWSEFTNISRNLEHFEEELSIADGYEEEKLSTICLWLVDRLKASKRMPMSLCIQIAASVMERRSNGICEIIIVDEFQDTDVSQFNFASQLIKPYNNLIAVGQLEQAIYRWRGALPENLTENFEETYPDGEVQSLSLNFRSTKNILLAGQMVLPSYYEETIPHKPARDEVGEPVLLVYPDDQDDQAAAVGGFVRECKRRGYEYSDMAVLYRNNGASRTIEQSLVREGIPVRIIKGMDFLSREEIKDFCAYWKWIHDPKDKQSAERVINKPSRKIGKVTAANIDMDYRNDCTRKLSNGGWPKKHRDDARMLASLNSRVVSGDITPIDLASGILYGLGLYDHYEGKMIGNDLRQDGLDTLMVWMDDCTKEGLGTEEAFDELFVSIAPPDPTSPCVSLMTMHSSKGLEYSCVMIVGALEGIIPSSWGDMQEECHLFYVAVTRAKDILWVSAPRRRRIFSKGSGEPPRWVDAFPSRFMEDMERVAKLPGCGYKPGPYATFKRDEGLRASFRR